MKNKLLNINNILRIVISLFVIVSMIKSCSKAYTWNDFMSFTKQLIDNGYTNPTITRIYNEREYIKQTFINNNDSVDNYNNWIATTKSNVDNGYGLYFSNKVTTYTTYGTSGQTFKGLNIQTRPNGRILASSGTTPFYQLNQSFTSGTYTWYLIDNEPYDGNYNGTTGQNYYNYINILTTENINNFPHYVADGRIGQFYLNDYLHFYLKNVNTEQEKKLVEITNTGVIGGNVYQLEVPNKIDLVNYDTYVILLKNNNNTYLTSEEFILSWQGGEETSGDKLPPSGAITNPSGDNTGNIDLSGITQGLENITEAQKETTQAIVSGNQEIINNLNDSSEVDAILNETLSGDIESVASDLGFTAFDNPFTSFLFFVVDGVYDVLTEREDITLNTVYKSLQFNLSSTDFITPESELKTFIRNMLICVYIYGNYKYFHYMITLLETARINKFMAEIGTDEFYDTDIM